MKPIAVISNYEGFKHLCYHCHLPLKNEVYRHVDRPEKAQGLEFSGMIYCGDLSSIDDKIVEIELIVQSRIR